MWFYDTGRDLILESSDLRRAVPDRMNTAGLFLLWAVKVTEKSVQWELCQVGIECGKGILTVQTVLTYSNLWGPP